MEWLVRIAGENLDELEVLSGIFNSRELAIIRDKEGFFLKSTDFDSLKDASDVLNRAKQIITLINGALNWVLGTQNQLTADCVIKMNGDGSRMINLFLTDTIQIREKISMSLIEADGTVQEFHQVDPIPNWVQIAKNDDSVSKVLRLRCTAPNDWVNLYRIYEVIEGDVGGMSKITDSKWTTEKEIKRFKHTANSPSTTGDASRHGKESTHPPSNPMSISEAEFLIKSILNHWVRSKK